MICKAIAQWHGSGNEGKYTLCTEADVLKETPHAFHSPFAVCFSTDAESITAAAHITQFTLNHRLVLPEKRITSLQIITTAKFTSNQGDMKNISLKRDTNLMSLTNECFFAITEKAKTNSPLSKWLYYLIRKYTKWI
ncbi:MAG: hypothetical protein NZ529_06930 [Cytophagaceae bacterium]|nr:hypothetical protein [Cytophagaceae bacterium]MDW8456515.1 hypothetical protein [Cytophagaceae bacterium]